MPWVSSANATPVDLKRVWYIDRVNGDQSLVAGPVAGTAAFQSLSGTGYGPTFWQESSQHGIAAEASAAYGDWTWEAFVWLNASGTHALFACGGWSGLATEEANVTALVFVNTLHRLSTYWEAGVNVAQNPSGTSGAISTGAWHHLAVVKDSAAKTVSYYIDGVASGVATYASNPTGGDSSTSGVCRTSIGGYVNAYTTHNCRISATTFSTTKRDATWIADSYAHLLTDGVLPTDGSTWISMGPILLADIERVGVNGPTMGSAAAPAEPDIAPPETAVVSPPVGAIAGDYEDVLHTELVLDTTDDKDLAYVAVFAEYGGAPRTPVYRRGAFEPGFSMHSYVEELAPGVGVAYRFHVRRDGGWPPGEVSLVVDPVDEGGNVGA